MLYSSWQELRPNALFRDCSEGSVAVSRLFLRKGVRDARDVVTFGYIGQCSDVPVDGGLIVRREDEQVFFGCLFHTGVAIIDHLNQ